MLNEEEFELFKATLLEKLPVTFRINPSYINHETLTDMLKHPKFVEEMAKSKQNAGDAKEVSMAHE